MNSSDSKQIFLHSLFSTWHRKFFVLANFFLIIFAYHILRDLKDTVIVTSCDTGAKIIPFIKIWIMLPSAFLGGYLFQKLYKSFGRDKTFYIVVGSLSLFYLFFAFYLFPHRDSLHLDKTASYLESILPASFSGWTNMIRFWSFSLFYAFSEMWSILVISVLFWTNINEITPSSIAKRFFPLCIMVGNVAGVASGQISYLIGQLLCKNKGFEHSFQIMICVVVGVALLMMLFHRQVFHSLPRFSVEEKNKPSSDFKESLQNIWKKPELLSIAALVISFALTSNLFEVIWKNSIKTVHPLPSDYNGYINQTTTLIGVFSLLFSFLIPYLFRFLTQASILLITPIALLITSTLFFLFLQTPFFANLFHIPYPYFIMTFGSVHYILSLSAKYSLFDSCKEIAFLSVDAQDRAKAKSMIDTVGSRLGKSGSSLLHQMLLILFSSPVLYTHGTSFISICFMVILFMSAKKLGSLTFKAEAT